MRKFSQEEISRFESSLDYQMDIFEGWSDGKSGDTLLLESVQDDVLNVFGGKAKKIDKNEADKAIKDAFSGRDERPEVEGDGPEAVYRVTKDGIELNEQSKRDWQAYEKRGTDLSEAQINKAVEEFRETDQPTAKEIQAAQELKEACGGGKTPDLEESIPEGQLLLETITVDWLEEDAGKPFTFRGRALKIDRINKNKRRYSKDITERALKEARESGQVLTCRDGHPQRGDTSVSPMIGRVVFGDLQSDGWLPYEATISNTSRGLGIQTLLRDKVIGNVSLRSKGRTAVTTEDGETFENVVSLSFRGLDLVPEGSEEGARADEIFNAAN